MTALIYDLVYTVPLCIAVTLLFPGYVGQEGILLPAAAVIIEIICVVFLHLKARGRALLFGMLAIPAAVMYLLRDDKTQDVLVWAAKILLVCVICLLVQKAVSYDIKIRSAYTLICLAALITFMITKHDVAPFAFSCIFFVIIANVTEMIQAGWKKEGDTDRKRHLVFMLPFLAALFIPVMIADIPQKPYDWRFVRIIITDIRDGIESAVQTLAPWKSWDNGDCMGFSEQANIGGSLTGYPYKAITVSTGGEDDRRIYLAGKSFDTFSGRAWDKKDTSDTDERSYDLLESVAAVMRRDPENVYDHLQCIRMRVKYEGVRTRYAFIPPKSSPETTADLRQKGGDLMLSHGRTADYFVYHYRINRTSDLVTSIMKEEEPIDRKAFALALQQTSDIIKTEHTFDGYQDYRKMIYDRYLPQTELSERASSYMDEVLSGAGSDYEKLVRIEDMLSGLRYTVTPGDLPETVQSPADFTDHLLFEKKEGYCSYFATAFVILARSCGIPARYVQGYSTLTGSRDYEVLSDRAHAWPEAYLDGVGWVIFEPTPGFYSPSGWEASKSKDSAFDAPVPYIYEEHETGEGNDAKTQAEENRGNNHAGPVIALSVFAFLLIFAICDRIYRRYRYMHLNDMEKILDIGRKSMKILRIADLKIRDGETLSEFAQRCRQLIPGEYLDFMRSYEEALYAPPRLYKDEVSDMEKQRKELLLFVICKRARHLV
ncbi:MAG: transglutaminase domain-containing protein [Lachnospiraceae bacterium]|nr:transglutaminase domain-containing protein [Lachnospiraceae bacterium]